MVGLHGPPSDYAWGPQGLENIITQMLANLEDDGPPPTQKEKLESLLTVKASVDELKECELQHHSEFHMGVRMLSTGGG